MSLSTRVSLTALLLLVCPAFALTCLAEEEAPSPVRERIELTGAEALQAAVTLAQRAMGEGEFEKSRELLEMVLEAPEFDLISLEHRTQARFLLGMTLQSLGEHREAVRVFRGILVDQPGLVRVRLELARALFHLEDDRAAEHHFRHALAGELPPEVQANVRGYLGAIRRRRPWDLDVNIGLVYDSNVNVAPSVREIEMYGLPFQLDDDARARTGHGVTGSVSTEYRFRHGEPFQLRLGGYVRHTEYRESQFNRTLLGGYAGPRFLFDAGPLGEADVSLLARGQRQWFGGSGYEWGWGGRLEAAFEPTRRLRLSAHLDHLWLDYDNRPGAEGTHTAVGLRPTFVLGPTRAVWLDVGLGRERAENEQLSFRTHRLGLGYRQDLPRGFTVALRPSYRHRRNDRAWPAFGTRRRDHTFEFRTDVLNRRLEVAGFTPVFTHRYQRADSTIDLYSFDQHVFEIGLTRRF